MLHALVAGCLDNPPPGEISAPRIAFPESELTSALADRTVTEQALIRDALWKLSDAFEALHRYRMPGGELDYLSRAVQTRVISIKNSEARSRRMLTTEGDRQISTVRDHAQIAAFLERRGYSSLNHGTKKTAVIDAVDHFKSSEPSVRRVIRDYGLSKR
jgi:hypothetical protein